MRRFCLLTSFVLLTLAFVDLADRESLALQTKLKSSSPKTVISDEEALKQAGLSASEPGKLLEYLEQRTLTDLDQGKLKDIIRNFGADRFEDRQKSSEEIERFGPAALGPLREAERDPDPEVAYRASEAVKKLNKVRHELVAAAAVRAVLQKKPPGAAKALLGFLPLAGDEAVADEIRQALTGLAVRDGKVDPAIVAALKDPAAVRRSAAYVALLEGQATEAWPKVKDAVLAEQDTEARFRGLWSMALGAKNKEAIPELVKLTPNLTRGRLWQMEDLLIQLASKGKPNAKFGRGTDSLNKARDLWLAWWDAAGGKIDLASFDYSPRILGYTDLVEMDPRGFGNWRVTSIGPDEKERMRLTNVANPSDARSLPNGHILIAEQNSNQVTERDATGKTVTTRQISIPLLVEPLADGGMLITGRNEIKELAKDGKEVFAYRRSGNQHDIVAARRLPGGETLVITNSGNSPENCFRLDAKGKAIGKPMKLGQVQAIYASIDVLDKDRVLITEYNRVAEYDLKTGKMGWSHTVNNPSSVQRLPNGNTLIASTQLNKVIEVDESNEVIWEYQAKDGLRVLRAYRR